MPTDREQIEATLDQLELKLGEQQELDPEARERLRALFGEVRATLDRPASAASGGRPAVPSAARQTGALVGRLGDSARHFEETHPELSSSLGAVATWLGQMGF